MRKSVALFLTLIFLTIILGVVGSIIGIYREISKSGFEKNISQNSVLIINIKSILDNITKDLNKSNIKKIYDIFPVSNKDGTFRVLIKIKPLLDKININEYKNNSKKKYVELFLNNVLEYYQIKDPIFFKALIEDTLDNDDIERIGNSEIKLKDKFFKNGKIYNYKHFQKILNYYAKYTEDKDIYKIPWKSLIWFGNKKSIIDCNIINQNVAKFLGLIFYEKLNCKELNREENKDILKKLSIIPFDKNISYLVDIEINYSNENLDIFYDINKKRIEHIKSNSLY
jgi:hypothetical protein